MMDRNVQPEHGEVGKPSRQTRLNHYFRTERKMWATLLLLPLLTYCVVAVLTFSIKPTPINTGDALYDKYLAWVLEDFESNINLALSGSALQTSTEQNVALDPFADWEAEFGDDPRYWMLRYRYAKYSQGNDQPVIGHLEKAKELGLSNAAILYTRIKMLDRDHGIPYTTESAFFPESLESLAESEKQRRDGIDSSIGKDQSQFLAELFEVAGDQSAPHYYSALIDFQRGNYQLAISHLRDGNQTPHNSNLVGFPFDVHLSNLNSGQPLTDKIINGSIFIDGMSLSSPDFSRFGGMAKLLVKDAISRNDWAALDEIHTFGCRLGMTKGITLNNSMLGSLIVGIVASEVRNSMGSSLSIEQQNTLAEITFLKKQVRTQRTTSGAWTQMLAPYGDSPIQQAIGTMEIWLSGGRRGIQAHIEAVSHDFTQEQATLNGSIKQLFQQMESFNYNKLEFE